MSVSSVPITLAALGNLSDNQSGSRELEDFLEVAEAQVPQVRQPTKRSPLELILQAVQPAVGAFAASRLARPRDRRRAFIGGLAQGFGQLGLREAARPRLEQERVQREEDVRGMNVLRTALAAQRTSRTGQPQSIQAVLAGMIRRREITPEEAQAIVTTPPSLQVKRGEGDVALQFNPRTGELTPITTEVGADLGVPSEAPVRLGRAPIFRTAAPGASIIDPTTGEAVFTAPERPEKPPSPAERKETERGQAAEAIDLVLARPDIAGDPLKAATFLRTGRGRGLHNLTTAQINVLLGVLEELSKPRRGIDPTGAAGRGSETQRRITAIRGGQ